MSATLDTRGVTHDPGTDWRARAACLDVDPETFFPQVDEKSGPRVNAQAVVAYEKARAVCRGCDVTRECLAWALACEGTARSSRAGVFAGTTPDQRHDLVRNRLDPDDVIAEALAPLDLGEFKPSLRALVQAAFVPCLRCDHHHVGLCDCGCRMAMRNRPLARES